MTWYVRVDYNGRVEGANKYIEGFTDDRPHTKMDELEREAVRRNGSIFLNKYSAEWREDDLEANPFDCPSPRQESDEYVCGKCRLRWDTHEEKPPCPRA